MTIAVAVRFPYGAFTGLPIEEGIVLATDSRFSPADPTLSPIDIGAKLWRMGSRIGAVFAGSVNDAERGMANTKRRLASFASPSFTELGNCARDGFRTAYGSIPLSAWASFEHRVDVALGTVVAGEAAGIVALSSATGFEPEVVRTCAYWAIPLPSTPSRSS